MPTIRGIGFTLLLAASLPIQAVAALGGPASSVAADQTHMKAMREVKAGAAYSVHEISAPNGTVVREFVSSTTGQVFAVTWQGPFMPDLKQVLGDHFATFAEAAGSGRDGRNGRIPRSSTVVTRPEAGHSFGRSHACL